MKKRVAAFLFGFVLTSGAFAEGLGISSKIYMERFNTLAKQMQSDSRLRPKGAKVTTGAQAMSVRMDLDRYSSVMLTYGKDRTKMAGAILFQELGGDKMRGLDAVTNMILTAMSAFDNPKALGVADMTVDVCGRAMKESGKDFKQSVMGVGISCVVLANGVLMLSVS